MGRAFDEIKELHRQTTMGAKEGIAFRYFSRPLASFILYFIRDRRITPNQVTIISLLVGIAGSVVHVLDLSYRGLLIGGALFMIAHMLDALDGQLARLRKAGSTIGMYFDFFVDELKAYFVFIAIALRLWRQQGAGVDHRLLDPILAAWPGTFGGSERDAILFIALVGLTGLAIGLSCTQFMKRDAWQGTFPAGTGEEPGLGARLVGLIETLGRFVIDYPSYILLLCIVDQVEIYFLVYTLVVTTYALRALFGIARKLWRVDPYSSE